MNAPKKSRNFLLLVGLVTLVGLAAVVAVGRIGTNSVSQALHAGSSLVKPSFKDIGKTISGTVNKSNYNAFGETSTTSTEAITLLQIIDPAQGVNNVDTPSPGTRFIVVKFKVADAGSAPIPIGFGMFDPVNMIGSDGQKYITSTMNSKTTPNCPVFPDVQIAPGQSLTGCLRFDDIPTSVKIDKITYAFSAAPSQPLFTAPKPWIRSTAVWSSQ